MEFHVARGHLPSNEVGLSGRVQLTRTPQGKLVGIFQLETSAGPLVLTASLEGVKSLPIAAAVRTLAQDASAGASHSSHAARRHLPAPQFQRARAALSGAAPPNVATPYGLPERLYAKLIARDPGAFSLVNGIIQKAQTGDPRAIKLWGALCRIHGKSKALDFTRATPDQKAAADRLYLRLQRKDPAAWQEVQTLVSLARQGNPTALLGWKLLCMRSDEAKEATAMGLAVTLSPARAAQLLQIIAQARWAEPPRGGGMVTPYDRYEPEPPAMGPAPGASPGLMAQYLAEKEGAAASSRLTATPLAVAKKQTAVPSAIKSAASLRLRV